MGCYLQFCILQPIFLISLRDIGLKTAIKSISRHLSPTSRRVPRAADEDAVKRVARDGGYTAQFTDQEEAKDALEPPEGGDCLHNGSISMPSARGMPQRVFTA